MLGWADLWKMLTRGRAPEVSGCRQLMVPLPAAGRAGRPEPTLGPAQEEADPEPPASALLVLRAPLLVEPN